jgi:hypothetical protein
VGEGAGAHRPLIPSPTINFSQTEGAALSLADAPAPTFYGMMRPSATKKRPRRIFVDAISAAPPAGFRGGSVSSLIGTWSHSGFPWPGATGKGMVRVGEPFEGRPPGQDALPYQHLHEGVKDIAGHLIQTPAPGRGGQGRMAMVHLAHVDLHQIIKVGAVRGTAGGG